MPPNLTQMYDSANQQQSAVRTQPGDGRRKPFRPWLQAAIRNWQKRRMISTFSQMSDEMLSDIGIERGDISRVVDGLLEREVRMAPTENRNKSQRM